MRTAIVTSLFLLTLNLTSHCSSVSTAKTDNTRAAEPATADGLSAAAGHINQSLPSTADADTVPRDTQLTKQPSAHSKPANPLTQPGLFDPARHIGTNEIKPGMAGYGLTVFSGTKPERFTVKVVSVIHNHEPGRDAIIIRCVDNEQFAMARGVQGVSGSPVYFNNRLAGAMAFGWAYSQEPLYGVTPIREMLGVRQASRPVGQRRGNIDASSALLSRVTYHDLMRDNLLTPEQINRLITRTGLGGPVDHSPSGLTTLPMPLLLAGRSQAALRQAERHIPGLNLSIGMPATGATTAQGVPTTAASAGTSHSPLKLEPGGTLAIPLISGDINGAILGTVTDVIDNQVYAFGHGWNGEGATNWPMATGQVYTFVGRVNISFKLGSALDIVGSLLADEAPAVYGELGDIPSLIPVTVSTRWPDTGFDETISAEIARDELLDPTLATLVVINSVLRRGGLPREHTIDYRFNMTFDGLDPIEFANRSSAESVGDIIADLFDPLTLLLSNPWRRVHLSGLHADLTVQHENHISIIESAHLSHHTLRPGDTLTAHVVLRPLRGNPVSRNIELELPDNLPDGVYKIDIGSVDTYRRLLSTSQPHLYRAYAADDVRRIMQERLSLARDRLYISMALPRSGLALADRALPDLPASKAALLADQSRQIAATPFKPVISNSIPANSVVRGSETFEITVRRP